MLNKDKISKNMQDMKAGSDRKARRDKLDIYVLTYGDSDSTHLRIMLSDLLPGYETWYNLTIGSAEKLCAEKNVVFNPRLPKIVYRGDFIFHLGMVN